MTDGIGQSAHMQGVWLTGHGGPERLVWSDEIPRPEPGPGEVLVKVLAAGVNNTDINTRVGWYSPAVTGATSEDGAAVEAGGWAGALDFPRIQGADLCGRVVTLGDGVASLPVGARVICPTSQPEPTAENPVRFRVIGSEYDGAFADYCVVPAYQLYDVSASPLSDVEIGAMPCAFGTAFTLLHRAKVAAGDCVLVTGASGGVGLAAVMLARHLGATVTAQAAAAKADAVRAAGAEMVLDRGEAAVPASVDVVIDLVGGPNWRMFLNALRAGGRYAVAGAIAGPMVEMDLRDVYLRDLSIFGCTYTSPEVFAGLADIINSGAVRPLVSKTYPLHDIAAAQADFNAKIYPGKLVLIP